MTDNDNEPEHDPSIDSAFNKVTDVRLGPRGLDQWERSQTRTDFETMTQVEEISIVHYCECGNAVSDPMETSRCTSCDATCCTDCLIRLSRRTLCPDCAEDDYDLDKNVYLTLLLLEEDLLSVTDLFTTAVTQAGEITVEIDTTLPVLLNNDYLRIRDADNDQDASTRITTSDDDTLSNAGKAALHIGEHLYSNDPDITDLKEKITVSKIIDRD